MQRSSPRQILEEVFNHFVRGEVEHFYQILDPNVRWTVHGENVLKGTYNTSEEVKGAFKKLDRFGSQNPKRSLRSLVIEEHKAAVFLSDECIGKDGKKHFIDYSFIIELSKDGQKIAKVENFVDGLQLQNFIASTERSW